MLKKNFPFPYGEIKPAASSLAEPQDMSRVRARNALKVSESSPASTLMLTLHTPSDLARHLISIRPTPDAEQHVGVAKDPANSIEAKVPSTPHMKRRERSPSHPRRKDACRTKRYCTPIACCICQSPCIQHVQGSVWCPSTLHRVPGSTAFRPYRPRPRLALWKVEHFLPEQFEPVLRVCSIIQTGLGFGPLLICQRFDLMSKVVCERFCLNHQHDLGPGLCFTFLIILHPRHHSCESVFRVEQHRSNRQPFTLPRRLVRHRTLMLTINHQYLDPPFRNEKMIRRSTVPTDGNEGSNLECLECVFPAAEYFGTGEDEGHLSRGNQEAFGPALQGR